MKVKFTVKRDVAQRVDAVQRRYPRLGRDVVERIIFEMGLEDLRLRTRLEQANQKP